MYRMNTLLKQTSLPTHSTSVPTTATENQTDGHKTAEDTSAVRTYVSRGLQTDLEVQPTSGSSSQMHYYEKQQSQVRESTNISISSLLFAYSYAGRASGRAIQLRLQYSWFLPLSLASCNERSKSSADWPTISPVC
jgi:hypothetical protein